QHSMPLVAYEVICQMIYKPGMRREGRGSVQCEIVTGVSCADAASRFGGSVNAPTSERYIDTCLRLARRCRSRMMRQPTTDWWAEIVAKSQSYSSIPLSRP